jgi:BASS family bile acid:Na+ symporter
MFDSYPQYEQLLAQVQLVLFMLGMGADLTVADFLVIAQRPKFFFIGAAGQFLLTPLLAVLINHGANLPPGIAVGLILVSAMPGGTLSKFFTYLGLGNVALSITLTAFGTLAALLTVPLWLRVLAAEYVPAEFAMPVGWIVRDVTLFMLVPLAGGMTVARFAPQIRRTFGRWCIRIGFVFVVMMVTGSIGSGRIHPGEYGWRTPLAIIFYCVLCQQLCMLPFHLVRGPRPDRLSVGIEVTMRNLNLALLTKALLFPATAKEIDPIADGVLFVILFWAGAALGAGLPLVLNVRRMTLRDARRAKAGVC